MQKKFLFEYNFILTAHIPCFFLKEEYMLDRYIFFSNKEIKEMPLIKQIQRFPIKEYMLGRYISPSKQRELISTSASKQKPIIYNLTIWKHMAK